jgi:hypothetical protein
VNSCGISAKWRPAVGGNGLKMCLHWIIVRVDSADPSGAGEEDGYGTA